TRAHALVAKLGRTVRLHAQQYRICRAMWKPLGVDPAPCRKYQDLTREDLYTNTKTYDASSPEGFREKLPWFWLINIKRRVEDDQYIASFFWLRWIHATLSLARSAEEIVIVEAEMEMVYASYQNIANTWGKRAIQMANNPGAQAFGFKLSEIWERQAKRSKESFNRAGSAWFGSTGATR
ncbi:hypothetical protein BC826DRAFT_976648, partial [Russula brevipes]